MSDALRTYRLYCYDSTSKILSADWLEAADDESAIAAAEAAGFGSKCEIWEGRRLVAQLAEEARRTA